MSTLKSWGFSLNHCRTYVSNFRSSLLNYSVGISTHVQCTYQSQISCLGHKWKSISCYEGIVWYMCLTTLQKITFTRKQIYMLKRQEKKIIIWICQSWFDTRQCFEKNLRKLKIISRYFSFCIRNPTYNYEVTLFLKWSDPTCLFIFFPVCCLRRCLQIEGHQL